MEVKSQSQAYAEGLRAAVISAALYLPGLIVNDPRYDTFGPAATSETNLAFP
jgi:hypothetical protein